MLVQGLEIAVMLQPGLEIAMAQLGWTPENWLLAGRADCLFVSMWSRERRTDDQDVFVSGQASGNPGRCSPKSPGD